MGKENAAFAYYWTLSKEMGILDHLTSLLRNLYAGQETTELDMEQQTGSIEDMQWDSDTLKDIIFCLLPPPGWFKAGVPSPQDLMPNDLRWS